MPCWIPVHAPCISVCVLVYRLILSLRWVFRFRLSVWEYLSVLLLVRVFASLFGAGVWRLGAVEGWQQAVPAWNDYICPQCVHTHGYLCSQWMRTHKTVYIVCIHVYMCVLCMFLVCGMCTCTPQNRAEGAKNPLAPSGPDPISESDVDQGSEGPHDPSPWP